MDLRDGQLPEEPELSGGSGWPPVDTGDPFAPRRLRGGGRRAGPRPVAPAAGADREWPEPAGGGAGDERAVAARRVGRQVGGASPDGAAPGGASVLSASGEAELPAAVTGEAAPEGRGAALPWGRRVALAARRYCAADSRTVLALLAVALAAVGYAGYRLLAERGGATTTRAAVPAGSASPSAAGAALAGALAGSPPPGVVSTASVRASPSVVVDVAGKVRHPGLRTLPPGSRVGDALRAAGGARPGTDLGALNLAGVLSDGQQVLVGTKAPPGVAVAGAGGGTASASAGPVNVNAATAAQLDAALPGVGPVLAQRIVDYRGQHGPFTAVGQLRQVSGIGPSTYADIAPHVALGPS